MSAQIRPVEVSVVAQLTMLKPKISRVSNRADALGVRRMRRHSDQQAASAEVHAAMRIARKAPVSPMPMARAMAVRTRRASGS